MQINDSEDLLVHNSCVFFSLKYEVAVFTANCDGAFLFPPDQQLGFWARLRSALNLVLLTLFQYTNQIFWWHVKPSHSCAVGTLALTWLPLFMEDNSPHDLITACGAISWCHWCLMHWANKYNGLVTCFETRQGLGGWSSAVSLGA